MSTVDEQAQQALRDAAHEIMRSGWHRGNTAGLSLVGDIGQQCCLMTGVSRSIQHARVTSPAAVVDRSMVAIIDTLGLPRQESYSANRVAVVHANDSQPAETGRDWAVATLRAAADSIAV